LPTVGKERCWSWPTAMADPGPVRREHGVPGTDEEVHMTTRRLPRSARGRALPRGGGTDTVSWPPALRGRSTLLCLLLLGWLGGGLLATAVATVTPSPGDLAYGLTSTAGALVGLLLLMAAGPRDAGRRRSPAGSAVLPDEPLPVRVPAQADHAHDDHREPALR
jgi:hypothetical protein